jgi:gliding motility-associated-like protein
LTGGGGGSYSWTGPSITAGGTTSTPTVSAPGNYTVLVTAANGCTATAVTTLTQNIVIPSVTMPGTQTITCASPTVSLIGSAGPSTCTALWNGGVCSGSTSFTASACSPNIYTLTVTNPANGCTNSGTVSVVPSVGIPIVNSSNTGSITCTNLTSQITATTAMTPVSYSWTGPGAIAGAATTSGTVSLGGTYQCVVTNTLTGCASTITTFVPTNTTAVAASIAPTASITCSTTSLTLNASPTGSYSYTWSPSPNLTGNSVSSPTVTLGGTYSVVITNTINGCVGNANVTVPSNTTIPVVTITVPSVTTTCANPTITISAASTPSTGVTYSWTAPGTGALNNVSLSNPIASGSGVFTVVVTNTASGCSSSLTQNTVQVTPDLAIPVTTLSSNAAPITCSNPTPSVSIATTASPVSYSWSPSSGIVAGTGTTATPSFSLAGSYSVIVTNTTSGCATSIASNVVTVTLDNTIPTITITPSQTLTCTTPTAEISTIVSPSSNLVYTWAGSGVSGSTTSSVVVNQAGVYSTTVINSINGCSVTAATSITSNTIVPTVTVSPNSFTTTCASPTVQLTASTSTSSVTYTWTSPGTGNLDNSSIGNPIASGSGIFTVSVTDASNGCSTALSQATVQVIADAGIPVINLSSSTETITCYNPTPSVAITTVASPVSYSWSPTSGIVAGTETTATPSFSLPNTYSVVVTNTVSGCATIVNLVTIYIDNTPPVITLSSGTNTGTITCTSPSVSISPSVTPSTNLTYSWSADPGISTPLNQAAATFTAAGIYTLAVTNTLTGCVSSTTATPNTFTVIANTNTPTVSVVPTSSNTVVGCGVNSSVTYTANAITANGSATYNWNPGAVTTSSFSASAAGVYTSVVIDAVSGCSTTTQFTVTGNSIVPNLSSSANASFPCGASSTSLSASSTNTNVSFSWTGPATAVITGSTTNTPTVDLAGNYVVTVTDLITGCINSNTISVTQTSITAAFTSDPSTGISPLTVNFTNQTTGATSYSWDFGNGSVSTSTNPTTVFTSGTYTVILTASTGSCSAPATGVIIVEDGLTLVIPNVFTPNGDGINDVFSITSTGVKEISLQIFNRWGQKLYEFSGPKASWDGIEPNGAKATDGTYFFFVKVTGFDDKVIEKNGTVNLFR